MRISALLCITLCVSLYASEYKSRIVATQLRNITRDNDSFNIETERGRFKIPQHNVSSSVRDKDNSLILKLLENESHYLSLDRDSNNEYQMRLEQRMRGGGPMMGLAAYYSVKAGCYSVVAYGLWKAMRATGVDQAMMDEARRLMGELGQRAAEEAASVAGAAGTTGAGIYANIPSGPSDTPNYGYSQQWQEAHENTPFGTFSPESISLADRSLLAIMLEDIRETNPRLANFIEGGLQSGFNTGVGSMGFGGMGAAPVVFSMGQAGLENVMANDSHLGNMAEGVGRAFIPLANSASNIGSSVASSSSSTASQAAKAGLAVGAATGVAQTAVSEGMQQGGSRIGQALWKYKEGIKSVFQSIGGAMSAPFVTGNASIEGLALAAQAFFTAMPGP